MQITPSEKNINLGEYYDLYVQNDTLLLADVLYYLMELQNLSMQFSHLYTSCLFSTPSNVNIEDIEYQQGIFSQFFRIVFTSICFSKLRFKICINNRWCLIRFWLNSNTLVTSEHIRMLQKPLL